MSKGKLDDSHSRFSEVVDERGAVLREGREHFPERRPREWHQTEGFREEAVCLEASRRLSRETTAHLNRHRRQWHEGTPVTTLQATVPREGIRVVDFLERHSRLICQA
jgi:hypothetical protein